MSEVLVVDDILEAAKAHADLIRATLDSKIEVDATDDPQVAIQKVKSGVVKVVVLDQRMPKMNGTDLFREIRKANPYTKGILLSGEADRDDVGNALKLGFSDYLHKGKIAEISSKVLALIAVYHADVSSSNSVNISLYEYRTGLIFGHKVVIELRKIEKLSSDYIFDDRWRTRLNVDAGESKEIMLSEESTNEIVLEKGILNRIFGEAGIHIPTAQLNAKIGNAIEKSVKQAVKQSRKQASSITQKFTLPAEPSNALDKHIKSRQYESAPVFDVFQICISKQCKACRTNTIDVFQVFKPNTRVALRQIDYFNDGTSTCTRTGIIDV